MIINILYIDIHYLTCCYQVIDYIVFLLSPISPMSSLIEFEIKFLIPDRSDMIYKLQSLWAEKKYSQRMMRRVNFDPIDGYIGRKRVRIRDEGDRVTCSFKTIDDDIGKIDCVQEVEVVVSDFDKMITIFKWLGTGYRNYQETKREKRTLQTYQGEVELCLDVRPGIPEFIEIEWPTQEIVENIAMQLWFDIDNGFFWSADLLYEKLGICTAKEINHWENLRFDNYPGI